GLQRGADVARSGQRLDALDRVRNPHPHAGLPARGIAGRADAGGRMNRLRDTWTRLRRSQDRWLVPVLIVVAIPYPFYVDTLQTIPLIGDLVPKTVSMVVMVAFTMMALGLNIVVGYAGLLDLGYVAFYAVGAYTAGWFASQQFDQVTFHFLSSVPSTEP